MSPSYHCLTDQQPLRTGQRHKEEATNIPPRHRWQYKTLTPFPTYKWDKGFRLQQSMEQSNVTTGSPVPQTNDGRPFCLSYHLKGVCNSNCGGCHAHRTLSPHERGTLSLWKSCFCAETHPVGEVSIPPWTPGGGSVGNTTISTRSRRSQSSRGNGSRDTRPWQAVPPTAPAETHKYNIETIN